MSLLRVLNDLRLRGLVETRDGLVYVRNREALAALVKAARYVFEHGLLTQGRRRLYDLCDEETGKCITVVSDYDIKA